MRHTAGDINLRRLEPALARRTLRVTSSRDLAGHLLLIESGGVSIEHGEGSDTWPAPCLAFLQGGSDVSLVIEAGSSASLIGLEPAHLDERIPSGGDTLRALLAGDSQAIPVERRDMLRLSRFLADIVRELDDEGSNARAARDAYLTLILIETCRLAARGHDIPLDQPGSTSLLQRFRQLVERDFQRNRSIVAYAQDLGITTDRLHDICRRTTGRTPLQLVHERLTREAALHLERSTRTVQQIAETLGFRDPTYFSHFFKRQTGLPPATYRQQSRSAGEEARKGVVATYADWP